MAMRLTPDELEIKAAQYLARYVTDQRPKSWEAMRETASSASSSYSGKKLKYIRFATDDLERGAVIAQIELGDNGFSTLIPTRARVIEAQVRGRMTRPVFSFVRNEEINWRITDHWTRELEQTRNWYFRESTAATHRLINEFEQLGNMYTRPLYPARLTVPEQESLVKAFQSLYPGRELSSKSTECIRSAFPEPR